MYDSNDVAIRQEALAALDPAERAELLSRLRSMAPVPEESSDIDSGARPTSLSHGVLAATLRCATVTRAVSMSVGLTRGGSFVRKNSRTARRMARARGGGSIQC